MATDYSKWLREALESTGVKQSELARHLGLNRSQVQRMCAGTRQISAGELETICNFLALTPPGIAENLIPTTAQIAGIPVVGHIAPNTWRESGSVTSGLAVIPAVNDGRFPITSQSAYRIDEAATSESIEVGDYIIAVPYADFRKSPLERDLLVRKRLRSNLESFQLLRFKGGKFVNCVTGNEEPVLDTLEIVGLVIGLHRQLI